MEQPELASNQRITAPHFEIGNIFTIFVRIPGIITGDQTYKISSLNMKRSLVLITAMLLLAACTSELDQSLNGNRAVLSKQSVLFHATIETYSNPDTKVYVDDQLRVRWNADDRITIFNKNTFNQEYRFIGEDGDNAGSFDKVSNSSFNTGNKISRVYAVSPYESGTKISDDCIISFILPAEQAYKQNSFGVGANTMVAATEDDFLLFKNVGGYLAIRLYGDNISVSKITLKGNNGEKIAGKTSISVSQDGLPSVTMTEEATETISIVCDPPVQIGTSSANCTDFWFVVPPTHFTKGFSVTVTDDKGGTFEKSTSNPLDIKRNTLSRMEPIKVVPNYDHVFVPFEDANFKAYCVENFDKDGDGEVSIAEAKSVTAISVNTQNIESVQGIEYMTSLTELIVQGGGWSMANGGVGKLTSLDVSNNTSLTTIACDFNWLTSLDVSNNTALTYLTCRGNQLTSLNVKKNTALTYFRCERNQLTSLDVSKNTALAMLSCYGNQLTSLDLNHNSALQILYCYENQLTSLDVSKNTALQNLRCDDNQFPTLDVSKNTALTGLWCNNNPLLTEIWLKTGQTIEDFKYDTDVATIKYKDASGSEIITIPDANFKAYCVENFDSNHDGEISIAEALKVESINVCTDNVESLQGIEYFTNLQSLECPGTITWVSSLQYNINGQLSALDVSKNTALVKLYCYNNQLMTIDVSKNTALQDLYCLNNQLTTIDVSNNTALQYLYCDRNQLTTIDVSKNTELYYLHCSSNQLTSLNFSKNTKLQDLYCNDNRLTSLNLSYCTALFLLDCSDNQLTSLDVSSNTALTFLDCHDNQLTSLSVSNNTALYYLGCYSNPTLTEIWLKTGQVISSFKYDTDVATIKYKNVPEAVDLGLSVKWASFNLGASSPEGFGDYYAWGELEPHYVAGHSQDNPCSDWRVIDERTMTGYNWASYKWCNGGEKKNTKYCPLDNADYWGGVGDPDNKLQFKDYDYVDDAARQTLGGSWRIPTDEDWFELINNCTSIWTTRSGVNGTLFKSNINGNSIFIPAAGYRRYTYLYDAGSLGYYWTSNTIDVFPCYSFFYNIYDTEWIPRSNFYRYSGLSIRPVTD